MKKIKTYIMLTLALLLGTATYAQVGIGTTTPDASSVLDIESTTQGLLIPRMTTVQRGNIATPAIGLQVYDIDTNSLWYYDGIAWVESQADNLYTADGTLTGKRIVSMAGDTLSFNGGNVGIGTLVPSSTFSVEEAVKIRSFGPADADILALTGASTFGGLIEGARFGHLVVGIQENGNDDAFSIISGGGGTGLYNTDLIYDKSVATFWGNGNVGIGTPTPTSTLDVNGRLTVGSSENDDNLDRRIFFRRGDGGAAGRIGYANNANSLIANNEFSFSNNSGGGYFTFYTNQAATMTEVMRITRPGNIGIGTDAPEHILDIRPILFANNQSGGINLAATNGFWDSGMFLRSNAGGSPRLAFDGPTTTDNIVIQGGNVGIGTTDPQTLLDVQGSGSVGRPSDLWNSPNINYFSASGTGATSVGGLYTSGSFRTSLVSNGYRNNSNLWTSNVINGFTGAASIDLDARGSILFGTEANKATGDPSVVSTRMLIDNAGNVGIGTDTPSQKLDVAGNIQVSNASGARVFELLGQTTYIQLQSHGAVPLQINPLGNNVGIGLAAANLPTQRLDVNGNIRLRGALLDSNNLAGTNTQFLGRDAGGVIWKDLPPIQAPLASSTTNLISGNQVQRRALTGDVTAAANSNATTIANGAVNTAKLADNSVNSAKIIDNTITNLDLNAGAGSTGQVLTRITTGSQIAWQTVANTLYTGDGTLTGAGNRTVTMGGKSLLFNGGNVGIGVAPTQRLHVNGNTLIEGGNSLYLRGITNASNDGTRLFNTGGNTYLDNRGAGSIFFRNDNGNGGSSRMTIANNGDVGIGTTIPAQKLSVVGGNFQLNNDGQNFSTIFFGTTSNTTSSSVGDYITSGGQSNRDFVIAAEQRIALATNRDPSSASLRALFTNGNGNGYMEYDGDGNIDFPSDRRIKKDIRPTGSVLDKINTINVVHFRYKDDVENKYDEDYGVIAQDVEKEFPFLVNQSNEINETYGIKVKTVEYTNFGVLAIKAIQELKAEVDLLKDEVKDLTAKAENKVAKNVALEAKNEVLQSIVNEVQVLKEKMEVLEANNSKETTPKAIVAGEE